jgi:hypothetical protein
LREVPVTKIELDLLADGLRVVSNLTDRRVEFAVVTGVLGVFGGGLENLLLLFRLLL